MFLGMYVAFLISYVCFYIQPENFDSRFQLSVGALFATIGNKYIVESSLPDSTTFTLVDALHALTLLFILATIGATIVSLRIGKRYKTFSSRKWDMIVAQVILLLYLIGNAYFIIHSISQGHFAETWHAG
jgi:phosphoglycerol transferase MdoB-like AlkP superfamily enzyme